MADLTRLPAAFYGQPVTATEVVVARDSEVNVRCRGCNSLLAELLTPPWVIRCRKCHTDNRREIQHPSAGA